MVRNLRDSRSIRIWSIVMSMTILFQLVFPTMSYALTGGPSQPEVNSFTPIGTSDMVDPFTGAFNYNIPLMDVGGYPINLAYDGPPNMDTEASWVGLGWNVNPGVINRSMRGIPDDFKGEDMVRQENNMRPNWTFGTSIGVGLELFGFDAGNVDANFNFGINYNNYNGIAISSGASIGLNIGDGAGTTGSLGLSANNSSSGGLSISPSLSFSATHSKGKKSDKFGTSIGVSYNSRQGLSALTVSASVSGGSERGFDEARKEMSIHKYSNAGGGSIGGSIDFMNNTYVPNIDVGRKTSALSGSFKLGGALFGGDVDGTFSGYFSRQELLTKDKSTPSYGFMYEEDGSPQLDVMLDFNREKERAFNRTLPNIHTTNHSYDIFSISGQGVGGTFRPFRSEIGYVHKNEAADENNGSVTSFEIGPGNVADIGVSGGIAVTLGRSGNWHSSNQAKDNLTYKSKAVNDDYEPYYFKNTGEITVDDEMQNTGSLLQNAGGFDPVRVDVSASGFYHSALAQYVKKDGVVGSTNLTANKRTQGRSKRNQIITSLTKAEAVNYGVEKYNAPNAKAHHLSEMTVLQNNGSRYVYGIPAYNNLRRDVSFNVTNRFHNNNFVYYAAADNSTNNTRGRDHYFNATELPSYAHSYLLTSVLSHDYVDSDGVTGPSNDDFGSYTKFEYIKTHSDYQWRAPYNKNEANYSEGLKTDPGDDRGSYIYGKKEIWYFQKIETKTHVAIFTLSDRKDGYGVIDENGGLGGAALKKLDKISLYSKPDYDLNGPSATPIKVVHFEYEYTLCKGVPNNIDVANNTTSSDSQNAGGKLTLKRVFFTYGNSFKGELSDYKFVYADPDHDGENSNNPLSNPNYDLKNVTGWGGFQPNPVGAGFSASSGLLNSEFPYVEQNKANQDAYVNAWALTSIMLPSGGRIDIDLEAKDYLYVQDKEAMEMFKVVGCSKTYNGGGLPPSTDLKNELYGILDDPKLYLFFNLPTNFQSGDEIAMFKALDRGESMNYRFLMDLTRADDFEYVEGYLHKELIEDWGITSDGYGWIKLKEVGVDDVGTGAHPIAKSTWQFARMNNPRKAFDQPDPQENAPLLDIAKLLASQVTNVAELFTGANGMLKLKSYGQKFKPNKSWIRLNSPFSGKVGQPLKGKIGGGARVKSIKMYDNWEFMSDNHSGTNDPVKGADDFYNGFQYGQEYSYEMEDGSSSGVATYEPMGNKDNPIIQAIAFSEEHMLAPDDQHYQETPFGESFYPGPSVGHRRVTIKNLQYDNVKRNATGKIIHEFYTCLDYPVRVDRTDLFVKEKKTGGLGSLLKLSVKNYAVASQGFVIETNDMHGKPKTQRVYGEGQTDFISGITYVYDHNFSNITPNASSPTASFQSFLSNTTKLSNDVNVITPSGTMEVKQIGIDFDMINDFGESSTDMTDAKIDFNTAFFLASIIPIVVPTVWPSFSKQKTRYRYASTTKVINRFGILREVIAHDLGASVSTRNLAWDSETGEVLLTGTTNEYGDDVYTLNYPAHWYYSGMGQAYQNIGVDLTCSTNQFGVITGGLQFLYPGDELGTAGGTKYWVDKIGSGPLTLIDNLGLPVANQSLALKIIRSGHRNMQAISIGAITMLENPLKNVATGSPIPLLNRNGVATSDKIIQSSVTEFSDDWAVDYCDCGFDVNGIYNPYIYNAKGTWRAKKSHLYLHSRTQTTTQNNREDGVFNSFNPFWFFGGNMWDINDNNWTWTSEVTKYSPYGFELENKDRLGRFSAAQYDYNNNLPVAVGNNTQYREIGFDSFEEYHFDNCEDDHFSFEKAIGGANGIVETTSHTGRKSFKVAPLNSVSITKIIEECK